MESDSAHTVIESCPACKSELDVTEFTPHSKIVCPSCGEKFRVRSVLGHYRIAKLLGEGGMSQVFAADDVTLGRRVALKILHQSFSRDESLTSMFEREAKLTAAINHPNVVKVYTVGRDQGYFYIAMELVWAVSVEQLIATKGAIKEELVLRIAEDVVSGLRAAQGENLIHRDIKPGNMLVMGDSTTKLVDFGLAVHQDGVDEDEDLWATPFYVPPEKLEGEADTYLGDIYSLGATLYHAIAGEPAFVANTSSLDELIEIKKQPVDLKSKATHASKGTIKLIDTLMAYKAEDRPQSYDEILEKIGEARQKAGITKEGAGSGAERRKQEQKLRKRYLLLGGIAAAVLALAVVLGVVANSKKNSDQQAALENMLSRGGDGERVFSDQERARAIRYLGGRQAMGEGRLAEAEKIFRDLSQDKGFSQPSRSWNDFNFGLVQMMLGEEKRARAAFRELKEVGGFPKDKEAQKQKTFFVNAANILDSPLPLMNEDMARYRNKDYSRIMLFAAGVKNWNHGEYESAKSFFEDFSSETLAGVDKWVSDLSGRIPAYMEEYEIIKSLPNPTRSMDAAKLTSIDKQLESAAGRVRTRSARQLIRERIERIDRMDKLAKAEKARLAAIQQKSAAASEVAAATPKQPETPAADDSEAETQATELNPSEFAEVEPIRKVVKESHAFSETLIFGGAAIKLEALKPESEVAQLLKADLIRGYRATDKYVSSIAQRLEIAGYRGPLQLRNGSQLEAKITGASPSGFIVDLGFGPNTVEPTQLSAKCLAALGGKTLSTLSESNFPQWEQVYWFALSCGLEEERVSLGGRLAALSPEFSARHDRVNLMLE